MFFSMTGAAYAQSVYYVRAGAAGSNNGSNWTNAYTTLPATLQRGATYYIADGSYGSYKFDDANSGTKKIIIKKAIASDHGTNTGWQASYGDGKAEWTNWNITTSYWEIDGRVGRFAGSVYGVPAVPGYKPYGFEVHKTTTTTRDNLVRVGHWSVLAHHITIRHTRIYYTNTPRTGDWGTNPSQLDCISAGGNNFLFEYLWVHDCGRNGMYWRGNGLIVQHSVYERNRQAQLAEKWSPYEHGQICDCSTVPSSGLFTWRYNWIRDWLGVGALIVGGHVRIYGNVFTQTGRFSGGEVSDGNGMISTASYNNHSQIRVYNNTFVNIAYGGHLMTVGVGYDLRDTRNNLFYNVRRKGGQLLIGGKRDYNWFYQSGSQSEQHIQHGSGNPFMNLGGQDYRLKLPTLPGALLSGYTLDCLGVLRGADGSWDRGAFEYKGILS
jgi:hypothetical protein